LGFLHSFKFFLLLLPDLFKFFILFLQSCLHLTVVRFSCLYGVLLLICQSLL
jgi:hypothetical protein